MARMLRFAALAAVLMLIGGCSSCLDCGSIQKSHRVESQFESKQLLPGHDYYYYGTETHPTAILAIDNRYTLKGLYWKPVPAEGMGERIGAWITDIERQPASFRDENPIGVGYMGAEILDPDGNRVGSWYSRYSWGLFKFPGDRVIVAYPPKRAPEPGAFSTVRSD